MGVPFEATTSFRPGTAGGPAAVLEASRQIDLFDLLFGRPYEAGIWMAPIASEIEAWSRAARTLAAPLIEKGGASEQDAAAVSEIEAFGEQVNGRVRAFTAEALGAGKLPVIVGGDHSTPFGAIDASAARHGGARDPPVRRPRGSPTRIRGAALVPRLDHAQRPRGVPGRDLLVQVGIRDLCEQEFDAARGDTRVRMITDLDLDGARQDGRARALARETIAELPELVHVSFDIDALDPSLCPGTGTPVPGGLGWDETMVWLDELAKSGRRVVSLDLDEVASDEWDAIVGSRLLYRLIGCALATR